MSTLSDFLAQQKKYNDQMNAYMDALFNDINHLNNVINQLQNSPGTVTPEDQASIDQLQKQSNDLLNKMSALDNLTPPVLPPG